jgi:hypothetical protein
MAWREYCEPSELTTIRVVTTADKTKGTVELVENSIGYWLDSVDYDAGNTAEKNTGLLVVEGGRIEVDAATGTYNAGDTVFDSSTSPTGVVNLTSGSGRVSVGVVLEKKVLAAQGKIFIKFKGMGIV